MLDLFRLCPPSLVGAYYLHPPDARAIFLHDDLLCNGTCSVTGGSITYWGGTNGKDPTCYYIENQYIKIWHMRLGGANKKHALSWGGGHQRKRSLDFKAVYTNNHKLKATTIFLT